MINNATAKKVISQIWGKDDKIEDIIDTNKMWQINDEEVLDKIIKEAFENNKKAKEDYKNGKKNALKIIVGYVMKETGGQANPIKVNEIIARHIEG